MFNKILNKKGRIPLSGYRPFYHWSNAMPETNITITRGTICASQQGAEAKHQPANWLRNKQAQELIDELAKIPQIRGIEVLY